MTDQNTQSDPKTKTRVPNAVRSARTREKLISTTIDCLYELGYHQTTTVLVAQRAGVSRGAMLHQFPSKTDLMLATFQRVTEMRGELHKERLAVLATRRERFMALIDVLWEAFLSPSGIARVELMLSSRSDPELAEVFEERNNRLDADHKERIWTLAQHLGIPARYEQQINAFTQLYAAALRGLAIDALRKDARQGADDSVQLLKSFQLKMLEEMTAEPEA